MSAVGVLTVHHEEHVRRETRVVVAATLGFETVGEAGSAEEALELALELRPGLLLVGAHMPGIDGFEASRRLLAHCRTPGSCSCTARPSRTALRSQAPPRAAPCTWAP